MARIYKNIMVAIDGSKSAENAFKKAVQFALDSEAKLTLVHVIDTRSFAAVDSYNGTIADRAEKYATDLLKDYQNQAFQQGLEQVELLIEYGSPKTIIPKEAAQKIDADLIICGATGLNTMERLLIGSVSEQITRAAKCDVLVVRNGNHK